MQKVYTESLQIFKDTIREHVESLVSDKVQEWNSFGITAENMNFMDMNYVNSISVVNKNNKLKFAATDFVVNYLISNANVHQLFVGDPAIYYKSKAKDAITQVEDTFINIGKRLAGDIAPGLELADSENDHYVQAFISDKESSSLVQDYYNNILGKEKAKDYIGFEGTDAQEFTSLGEHLYMLEKMGKITDEVKASIEKKVLNNEDLSIDEIGEVLQPAKPVYVQNKLDIANDVDKRIYIKSSSFPLFEQITKGLEIDKLRVAIEKGIDRVAFSSAVKVGDFAKPTNIFNEDGTIKDDINLMEKSMRLPRTGFKIQQEVPYDENKSKVNDGSQQRKLLFSNILDVEGVEKSQAKYLDAYNELFKIGYENILRELQVQPDGSLDIEKLQDILKSEAISRDYSINEIQGLELDKKGRFVIPLAHNPSSSKIEALLSSIVDNRVRKKKMKGASFVLGTEEGFQVSNLEDVKQSDIVFTKEFTGELLPQRTEEVEVRSDSYTKDNINEGIKKLKADENITISAKDLNHIVDYEAGDKKQAKKILELINSHYGEVTSTKKVVKPAQIIIPFKFRDSKGNLLNAKDFIKDGLIDTSRLPKELLQIFGFRIPTQGLNSMSYMEVVGFLPKTSGDLLIAPRDFVIQMGSDFDIDKLYSYMYNTTYSNGKLSKYEFDESEIDALFSKKNDSTVDKFLIEIFGEDWHTDEFETFKSKFKELELQNTILDVHFDILSNPDERIQSQIAEPLGFGTLKEDAAKISGYLKARNKDKVKFSPLSDKYQKQKFINATAGQAGIGVFSLDSVFNAISQGKNLSLQKYDETIEQMVGISVQFGNENSNGNLSSTKTIKGKRYKSEVISAYQSASVDNEKEQILDKLNINKHTFDVIRVLNQLGFEEDTVTAFINQDIIRDYVEETIKVADITSDTFSGREEYVVSTLIKKYAPLMKETDMDKNFLGLADIGSKELLYMIQNSDNHKDNLKYQKTQASILFKFKRLKELGLVLADLQSTINTDSAGLNKSMIINKLKAGKLDKLGNEGVVANASKLIGDYIPRQLIGINEEQQFIKNEGYIKLNDYLVKPNTINGFASMYALNLNSKLWDKFLPYGEKSVMDMFKAIELESTNRDLSINQKDELYTNIWKNIKSYIYTSGNLGLSKDKDITVERERLMFDTKDNKSLASIIQDLKTQPVGKTNPFLNKLTTDIHKGNKPSLIKFDAATGENFDELNIYAGFVDLITNEREIGEFNDIKYTTRTLAQDLILQQYATGGIQEAIQFIKYIPQSYLNTIGFSKGLNDLILDEQGLKTFERQYFQHNPSKATILQSDSIYLKDSIKDVSKTESITIIKESEPLWKIENGYARPPRYISMYNVKSGNKFNLYELGEGLTYHKIDTLGTFGYKEYDKGISYSSSLIQANKSRSKIKGTKDIPEDVYDKYYIDNEEGEGITGLYSLNEENDTRRTLGFLGNVITNSTNPLYKEYAKKLLENVNKVNVVIETDLDLNARGATKGNVIYYNPSKINSTKELEKVLLHELTHAFTNQAIKSGSPQVLRLQGIFNELKNNIDPTKLKTLVEKLEQVKQGKKVGLTVEEAEVTYGAYNLQEFVALAMTSTEFQDILKTMKYSPEKSFFQELVDRIVDVLETLGLTKDSALKDVITDVFGIIESNIEPDSTTDYLPSMINQTQEIEIKLGIRHTDGTRKRYLEKNYEKTLALRKKLMTRVPDGYTIKFAKQTGEKGDRRMYDALIIEREKENEFYYLPDLMDDGNRFIRLINEVQFRKRQVEQSIVSAKKENNLKRLEELNSRLAVIDDEISELEEASKLEDIQFLAERDLNRVKNILVKEKVTASELHEASRILNVWKKGRELFFNEDEKTSTELNHTFGIYQIDAENYADKLTKLQYKLGKEFIKDEVGVETTISEIFAKQQDVSFLASRTLDISRNDNALLQSALKSQKVANDNARKESEKVFKDFDNLLERVNPLLPKGSNKYDMFLQQDSKGRYTGDLVHMYSTKFFETKSRLRRKAKATNKKEDWNKYLKWKKENEIIFDVRKLFPDKEVYTHQTYDKAVADKHREELKSHLGEASYNKLITELEDKIKKYKETYDYTKERIDSLEELTDKEKAEELKLWELTNSPYYYSKMAIDGQVLKYGKDFIRPKGYEYTYEAPRRVDTKGKATEWYDKDFEKISNNETLLEFYEYILDTFVEMTSYLPPSKQDKMQINTIPEIRKSTLELFSEKGMKGGFRGLFDKFTESNLTDDVDDVSFALRDPVTGEVEKSLNIKHLSDKSATVSKLLKIKKINHFQTTGKEATAIEVKEMIKDIKNELAKEKSLDLGKVLKAYTSTVLSYKHKAGIEDQLRLVNSILHNTAEIEFTSDKRPKVDPSGNLVKKTQEESFTKLKAQYDYFMDAFYGKTRNLEGVSDIRKLTKTEKEDKKDLESKLEINERLFKSNEIDETKYETTKITLETQIEELGGNVVGSKIGDNVLKYVQLKGMGWNVFSAFSNMGFGVISNLIEASDGRAYSKKQFLSAMWMVKASIGKNLTFNVVESKQAKKIRSLMDSFDVLKDATNELYESTTQSGLKNRVKFASPYNLQARSEYVNQAPMMIALMMNKPVTGKDGKEYTLWEAYDENGDVKENFELDQDLLDNYKVQLDQLIKSAHGNYDPDSPLLAKQKIMGRALTQFRTWMFEGFSNRFESEKFDSLLGYTRKGRYVSLYETVKESPAANLLFTAKQLVRKLTFRATKFDEKFSEVDAANMRKNLTELVIYMNLLGIGLLLKSMAGDDEDKNKFLINYTLNQMLRLQTDISFYTNPASFESLTKNSVPALGLINDAGQWIESATLLMMGEDEIKGGINSGDSRFLRETMQSLPFGTQVYRNISASRQVFDK